jgi:RNA polymerase sigma-70 factor (ECF subfamily)
VHVDEERLFEAYFRVHAGQVHAFALRRADPEAAQDVTAETFSIAWRRRGEMPAEPLPWLYSIARGALANEQRSANRRLALAARLVAWSTPPATPAPENHEILPALAALRESDREALLLSAWEGLTPRDAARVLGCSATTFAVRLHRARRRLARVLREAGHEVDAVRSNDSLPEVST